MRDSNAPITTMKTPQKSPDRRVLADVPPNTRTPSMKVNNGLYKPQSASPLKQASYALTRVAQEGESPASAALNPSRKRGFHELETIASNPPNRVDVQPSSPTENDNTSSPPPQSVSEHDHEGIASQDTSATKASFSSLIDYNPNGTSSQARASSSPPTSTGMPATRVSQAETLRLRLRVALYKVRTNQTGVPMSRLKIDRDNSTMSRAPSAPPAPQASNVKVSHDIVDEAILRRKMLLQPSPTKTRPTTSSSFPQLLPAPTLLPTAYSTRFVGGQRTAVPSSPPAGTVSPQQLHSPVRQSAVRAENLVTPTAARIAATHMGVSAMNKTEPTAAVSFSDVESDLEDDDDDGECPDCDACSLKRQAAREKQQTKKLWRELDEDEEEEEQDGKETEDFEREGAETKERERHLTSSAVKGRVANGLLELMRAG